MIPANVLKILRCPRSGSPLRYENKHLVTEEGSVYPIDDGVIDFVVDADLDNQKVEKSYSAIAEYKYDRLVKSPFLMKLLWGIDLSKVPSIRALSDKFTDGGLILDVPCGTGAFENDFYMAKPDTTFIAVDYTMGMIRNKKKKCEKLNLNNVVYIRADVSKLPFNNNSLDGCISLNGMHAFPDPVKAVNEIGRCLVQGGLITVSVVCSKIRIISDIIMKYLMIPRGIYMSCLQYLDYRRFVIQSGFNNTNIISQIGSLIIFEAVKGADD